MMNEKQFEAWYAINVLKPQLDKATLEAKKYLWGELLNDMPFDKVSGAIVQYLMMHKSDVERMKDALRKDLLESVIDMGKKKDYIHQTESLTELEKTLVDFYNARNIMPERTDGTVDQYKLEELLMAYVTHIKEIARKEVLKQLPTWKKAKKEMSSDTIDYAVLKIQDGGDHTDYERVVLTNRVYKDESYVELGDLINLPKITEE